MANYMCKEGSAGLDFDQSKVEMKDFEEAIESPYDVSEGSVSLDFDKDKLEEIIEEVLYYSIGAKKAWKKKKKSWRSTSTGQGKFTLPELFCVINKCYWVSKF